MRSRLFVVVAACLVLIGVPACATGQPTAAPLGPASVDTSSHTPTVTKQIVTETQPVPFEKSTVDDSSLDKGKTVVRTAGVDGVRTRTYEVTLTDGVETDRRLISDTVTTQPVTQVSAVGTRVAAPKPKPAPNPGPSCDPNYSGACVPIASDVDCLGGTGDGPAYVQGPVYVIGTDIYGLDKDHDGVGCE
jgi:hypothetical protein